MSREDYIKAQGELETVNAAYNDAQKEIRILKNHNERLNNREGRVGPEFQRKDMGNVTENIEVWARERNLHDANPDKQILKLVEEFGELAEGLAKNDPVLTVDAIGDCFVVLTILSMQLGLNIDHCANMAYMEIKDRKGKLVNGTFIKEEDLK